MTQELATIQYYEQKFLELAQSLKSVVDVLELHAELIDKLQAQLDLLK